MGSLSLVAVLILFLIVDSLAQWKAIGPGPFRYDDPANWERRLINDEITSNPGVDQTIDFTSDRTMPKGLLIRQPLGASESHYGLTFRARDEDDSIGGSRTLTLAGPILVDFGGTNDVTAYFGSGDKASLNWNFNNAPAVVEVPTGNSHAEVKGAIFKARGLTVRGGGVRGGVGRLLLSGENLDITGQVLVHGAWLRLSGKSALPDIKALRLSELATISIENGGAGVIDRLPDTAPISCTGGTTIRLTMDRNEVCEESVGKVSLDENCLELWASAKEGGSSVLTVAELVRTPETILIVGYETPEAPSRVKVANDRSVLDALVGGRGGQGSTAVSIIPWVRGHGGGNLYAAAGLLTYSRDEGFRELAKESEYAQDIAACKPTDNVRIASGSAALAESKTVNALFFDPPPDLDTKNGVDLGGNTLTVTSGAISLASEGYLSNGTVTTGSNRPLIISGPIFMNASLSGTGGLIYFGGRYPDLRLDNAENSLTGDYVVAYGAIRLGDSENIPDSVTVRLQQNTELVVDGSESITGLAGNGRARLVNQARSALTLGRGEGSANRLVVGQGGELHPGDVSKGEAGVGTLFVWHPDDNKDYGSVDFEDGTLFIDLAQGSHDAVVLDSDNKCANIMGGTLRVNLLSGYQPKVGQRWEIIKGTIPTDGEGFETIIDATGKGYKYLAQPNGENWVLELVGKP